MYRVMCIYILDIYHPRVSLRCQAYIVDTFEAEEVPKVLAYRHLAPSRAWAACVFSPHRPELWSCEIFDPQESTGCIDRFSYLILCFVCFFGWEVLYGQIEALAGALWIATNDH